MKVNKVYAEEIAKWDGDKATKPFRVLWDDPENGADLKVVYRTPKIGGTIIVALGIAAIACTSYLGGHNIRDTEYNVLAGCCILFVAGIGWTVGGLRTGWTRMEYEFKHGVCTVRYALAGLLHREWSFAYNDKTALFSYMRPMSRDLFATVSEYGFADNEGGILFRTKQAMKLPHYDYFSLVVTGYLSRNDEEEKSRQVLAAMRLERNLRDKSAAKKMWIFLGIVFAVSVTMSVIGNRNKLVENERRLAVKAVIEAFYDGGDYRAVAEEQKAKCRKRTQEDIDEALDYCTELSAARRELQESGAISDANRRKEALQGLSSRLRERVKAMKSVSRRNVASYVFENSFERLAATAEALLSAPDGKMTITIKENMKTATPQQSTEVAK